MDFDKIITGIRKALYGREVREYIASAIEWVKSAITDALEKMKELLRQAEAARDAAKASADKSAASATDSANSAAASKKSADASAASANASASSATKSAGYATASANSANESAGYASDSAASAAASEASAKNSANAAMKALQEAADSGAFKGDKGDKGDKGTTNASEINAGILGISYGGTGASTLDQACGNLLWRDTIPENCNWDTLATGVWRTVPERWGTNGPTSVYTYGAVFVWNYAGNVTQIYISHSSTDPICFRQRWTSNNSFAHWQTASTLFATKATGVTDYNNSDKLIQIGYEGAGLNTSNLTHIAGYTDNGTKIKDVSKDVLKSWLGLDSAASGVQSSGSNYIRFGDGTQICWGTISSVTVTVTGTVEYELYLQTQHETISRNFSAARITFPQAFSNTSYSVVFQNSYNVTDANTYIGSTFDFYSNKYDMNITGGKLVSISSTNPAMGKVTTGCTLNSGGGSMYVAVGRWK